MLVLCTLLGILFMTASHWSRSPKSTDHGRAQVQSSFNQLRPTVLLPPGSTDMTLYKASRAFNMHTMDGALDSDFVRRRADIIRILQNHAGAESPPVRTALRHGTPGHRHRLGDCVLGS